MRGQPLESAKKALITVVKELPKSVFFDVVMFDQTAMAWQPRLVPDTAAKKQDAARAVIARETKGGTASHAALNAIFGLGPAVIYFLSEGGTDGRTAKRDREFDFFNPSHSTCFHPDNRRRERPSRRSRTDTVDAVIGPKQ